MEDGVLDESDKENDSPPTDRRSLSPSISQYLKMNEKLTKRAQTEKNTSSSDSDVVLSLVQNPSSNPRKRRKIIKPTLETATSVSAPIPGISRPYPLKEDGEVAVCSRSLERQDLQ
jgi:hypothetical protein